MNQNPDERSHWREVTEIMDGQDDVAFGRYIAYWFKKSPRRALHYISYYKFATKMIGKDAHVLDVGCSEGLGTWLIKKECGAATGVDLDEAAIAIARSNWEAEPGIKFLCQDFMESSLHGAPFSAAVSFDVIEHIRPEHAGSFFQKMAEALVKGGVAILGTPSLQGQAYASEVSKKGHINLYTAERLEEELRMHFTNVFLFAANDEVVHTGYMSMAHYLIALAVRSPT